MVCSFTLIVLLTVSLYTAMFLNSNNTLNLHLQDSHLEAIASDGATSPDAYASSMDKVISTAYDILNRKLFSLPKLILLPGVISRKPSLLIQIFPVSLYLLNIPFLTKIILLKGFVVITVYILDR